MTAQKPKPDDNLVQFPDLKKSTKNKLLAAELGTQFDIGQRLFAYYGAGDVFDLARIR